MSLSVIADKRDGERTHTKKFNTLRNWNENLKTSDIQGAQPKLWGSRETNKPDMSN